MKYGRDVYNDSEIFDPTQLAKYQIICKISSYFNTFSLDHLEIFTTHDLDTLATGFSPILNFSQPISRKIEYRANNDSKCDQNVKQNSTTPKTRRVSLISQNNPSPTSITFNQKFKSTSNIRDFDGSIEKYFTKFLSRSLQNSLGTASDRAFSNCIRSLRYEIGKNDYTDYTEKTLLDFSKQFIKDHHQKYCDTAIVPLLPIDWLTDQNIDIYSNKVKMAKGIVRRNCYLRCQRWIDDREKNLESFRFKNEDTETCHLNSLNSKSAIKNKNFRTIESAPDFFFRSELMKIVDDDSEFNLLLEEAAFNKVKFSEAELEIIRETQI